MGKLFDDSLKLVRPRVPNGEFIDNFNPLESWRGFQEGNAVQYTFFVPQHPYRLIEKWVKRRLIIGWILYLPKRVNLFLVAVR